MNKKVVALAAALIAAVSPTASYTNASINDQSIYALERIKSGCRITPATLPRSPGVTPEHMLGIRSATAGTWAGLGSRTEHDGELNALIAKKLSCSYTIHTPRRLWFKYH